MKNILKKLNDFIYEIQTRNNRRVSKKGILALLIMAMILPVFYKYSVGGYRNLIFVMIGLLASWIISVEIFCEMRLFVPISFEMIFVLNNILIWGSNTYKGVENRWDYADFIEPMKSSGPAHYPPLSIIIYRLFNKLITVENDDMYVINYSVFLVLLFSIMGMLIASICYMNHRSKMPEYAIICSSIGVLLTSPFLFAIQRLNVILFAIVGIMFFILFYNANDSRWRIIAIVFLVFAANIKYYPAIFGALFIKERRWKESIIATIAGILTFVFSLIGVWKKVALKELIENTRETINQWKGAGISISTLVIRANERFGIWQNDVIPIVCTIMTLFFLLISICAFFVSKKEYIDLLLLGMICIFVPTYSFWYSVVFILPAILSFVCKKELYDINDMVCMVLMTVISMYAYCNTALFHMNSVWHLLILWLVCIIMSCLDYIKGKGKIA